MLSCVCFSVSLSSPYSVEVRSMWITLIQLLPGQWAPSANRRFVVVIYPILIILYDALVLSMNTNNSLIYPIVT